MQDKRKVTRLAQSGWSLQRRGTVFYVRYQEGAHDRRISTGQKNRAAATRWVHENLGETLPATRNPKPGTGYDWQLAMDLDIERCVNRGRAAVYIDNDVRQRHQLLAFFDGKTDISRSDLEAFRDMNRRAGRRDNSTRRGITVLRRGIKLLTRKDIRVSIVEATDDPDMRSDEARDPKRKGSFIPEAELTQWLAAMKQSPRALAVLELTTGLRWGEVRRLTPDRLKRTTEYPGIAAFITLPEGRGKDKSGRTMALCTAAYDALCHLWATKPDLKYDAKHSWRTTARRVGIQLPGRSLGYVHERDMRHNFATCNGEKWDDIVGLMRTMGHLRDSHDRYQSATPRRLVKFALHAAETYGLMGGAARGCAKVSAESGTLGFVGHFLKMRYIG